MKAATAKLLRAVIRLVEDDVRELADTVVEIDEREANNAAYAAHVGERVAKLERIMQEHLTMHVDEMIPGYSRKASS